MRNSHYSWIFFVSIVLIAGSVPRAGFSQTMGTRPALAPSEPQGWNEHAGPGEADAVALSSRCVSPNLPTLPKPSPSNDKRLKGVIDRINQALKSLKSVEVEIKVEGCNKAGNGWETPGTLRYKIDENHVSGALYGQRVQVAQYLKHWKCPECLVSQYSKSYIQKYQTGQG